MHAGKVGQSLESAAVTSIECERIWIGALSLSRPHQSPIGLEERMDSNGQQRTQWVEASAAAALLGIEVHALYRSIDEGHIPAFRLGGVIHLRRADLEDRTNVWAGSHLARDGEPTNEDDTAAPTDVASMDESPKSQELAARLDAVRAELLAATEDFTRLRIRDESRAVAAAAVVLNRRDIEVEASLLCSDAEREVVKHNPPLPASQGPVVRDNPTSELARQRKNLVDLLGNTSRLRMLRRAHAHMDDDEYDRIKAEHRARLEPLYRSTLLRYAGDRSTGRHPKGGGRKDRDVSLRVTITQAEYKHLRSVADRHGWSDTQALREAIRRLAGEGANEGSSPRSATAKPEGAAKPPEVGGWRPLAGGARSATPAKKRPSSRSKKAPGSQESVSQPSRKPKRTTSPRGNGGAAPSTTPVRRGSEPVAPGERIRLRPVLPSDMGGGAYADVVS